MCLIRRFASATIFYCCIEFIMSLKIVPLPNSYASLGEGPHWDIATQSLYYVDIDAGKLLRYDYETHKIYNCKLEGEKLASFIIPVKGLNETFAVGCSRRVVLVHWNGKSSQCFVTNTLFKVQNDAKFSGNRFNDGKCDPQGRLYAGTMKYTGNILAHRLGELYKYEGDGRLELIKSNIGISNGLAWHEARKKFYYIDTLDYEVKEYDYEFKRGILLTCPKIVYDFRNKAGQGEHLLPDGMTIDTQGNLYVAIVNNGTVTKIDPRTGKLLMTIQMPVRQVTSVAWGGPKLDILYVTTAFIFNATKPAGTTYKIEGLGASGLAMNKLRLSFDLENKN